jgi:hypothetical protein
VSGDVTTLVIGVDGEVETHQLDKVLVLTVAQEGGQVLGPVGVGVDGSDLALAVDLGKA